MAPILHVPPQKGWEKIADLLMVPVMYAVSGTLREAPQRTHRWNNLRLTPNDVSVLDASLMAHYYGRADHRKRGKIRFHLPIFGGWRDYVAIRPEDDEPWHVGWIAPDVMGMSRIRITGAARVLRGNDDVCFFGISAKDGRQLRLEKVGTGTIGQGGPYARLPLL